MTDEWKPTRVVKIDREIASYEEHERTLDRDLKETREILTRLRAERSKEMGSQQATVTNWGGSTE